MYDTQSLPPALSTFPTVFAVGNTYQIIVPFTKEAVVWVRVGETLYYDDANGILRSAASLHRIEVPMQALDSAKQYTLAYRVMTERKPYFPTSEETQELTVSFRPLPAEGAVRIYHISDCHNLEDPVIRAGSFFGKAPDLLILNGDVPDHSGSTEKFETVYRLASALTGGERPVVFARGNHDTRGLCAEQFGDYTPTRDGKTYYTFRLGSLWGMVLDCGEDKNDDCEEYGHTVCFHRFREKETEWIRHVVAHAEEEYAADGVKHRLLISHIPFSYIQEPPFDIEQPLYAEWCRLMREHVKPDLALHGHLHQTEVWPPNGSHDHLGQACTAVIGSRPIFKNKQTGEPPHFVGTAVTLDGNRIQIVFNDDQKNVLEETEIRAGTRE